MLTRTKTKKWGNSIGIVIPKEDAERMNIKMGEIVMVEVKKKENVLRELFGNLKFKKSTEELLKEVRKDMGSKWM